MARPLRVGGRGTGPDGASVIWSVAEGSRGARWREVRNVARAVAGSLLLETDPAGRFAHLELATPSGLLTLHPEPDGTLHGHAIVSDGIEHAVGLPWEPDGIPLIEGSVIALAAATRVLATLIPPGTSAARHAIVIPATLVLDVVPVRVERIDEGTWRFGDGEPFAVDRRGLPVLRGAETWPLEQDEGDATPARHR